MRLIYFLVLLLSSTLSAQVAEENKQLVLVLSEGWESTSARLYRFSRQDDASWKLSPLDPVPAVIGRAGIGWGIGLHPLEKISKSSPQKKEGDGKAPAGIFKIGTAFGYDELRAAVTLDKLQLVASTECVDDPNSEYYNKIVDKKDVSEGDWKSSESMRRKDDLYRLGIVIQHNPVPAKKDGGSCIFFHLWEGPRSSTAGCTASHEHHVRATMEWLNPDKKPLWIQLPWSEYMKLKEAWRLPDIDKKPWPLVL